MSEAADKIRARIEALQEREPIIEADLMSKFREKDRHGIADAAMDLRDVDAELKGLEMALKAIGE